MDPKPIVDHLKQIEYITKSLPRIEQTLKSMADTLQQIATTNQQLVGLLGQMPAPTTTVPLDVQVSARQQP